VVKQLVPGVTRLGPPIEWQIVGVYGDVLDYGPRDDGTRPTIHVPFRQSPWPGAAIAVRSTTEPASLQKSVADVVHSLEPDLPLSTVRTMEQLLDESMAGDRFQAVLFGPSPRWPCCSPRSGSTA
jgi:putative ABC transport system permease protein